MKYVFNFLLIACLLTPGVRTFAQVTPAAGEEVDSSRTRPVDTLKQKFYPRSIRFGTDGILWIKSVLKPDFYAWEFNGDIDFGTYYLAVDHGRLNRNYEISNGGLYDVQGTYSRIGWDANLLRKDPDRNMLFLGFRVGWARFQESTTISVNDPVFGAQVSQLNNPHAKAVWAELTGGLRVKIWSRLWLGYTARFKFLPSVSGSDAFETYEIPGYGLRSQKLYWGFNYQIFWSIPLKKKM